MKSPSHTQSDLFFPAGLRASSADAMFGHAVRMLLEHGQPQGSRDGGSTELLGYECLLLDLERTFVMNPARNLDPAYAGAEVLWYLSGQSDIERIQAYAPQYSRFAEHGTAWGAYGRRLVGSDLFNYQCLTTQQTFDSQLHAVVEVLKAHPESRQAVVALWNDGDLPHAVKLDKKDMPCTLSLQFFLRQSRLHLKASMRSNDVWLGLPYDVYAFTCIQRVVASMLDVRVGQYMHTVGSLHLYDRDRGKAEIAARTLLSAKDESASHGWWAGMSRMPSDREVNTALRVEELARKKVHGAELYELAPQFRDLGTCVSDAAVCCLHKWIDTDYPTPYSGQLRRAVERRRLKDAMGGE